MNAFGITKTGPGVRLAVPKWIVPVSVLSGALLLLLAAVLSPSLVASRLSSDGTLEPSTLSTIQLLRGLMAVGGLGVIGLSVLATTRWLALGVVSFWFALLAVLFVTYQLWALTADDTFIFFRLADNIANGKGYVWNVGDGPLEVATSALWLGLLVLSSAVGMPLLVAAKLIGAAAFLGSVWLAWRITARLIGADVPAAGLLAVIAALTPFSFPRIFLEAMNGMESSLFTFLCLALLLVSMQLIERYTNRRGTLFAVLCLLTSLARPEGIVFAGAVVVWAVWIHRHDGAAVRSFVTRVAVYVVIPGLTYMVWRVAYFGTLFPTPFYVKANVSPALFVGFVKDFVVRDGMWLIAWPFLRRDEAKQTPWQAVMGFVVIGVLFYGLTNAHSTGGGLNRYLMPVETVLFSAAAALILKRFGENVTGDASWVGRAARLSCVAVVMVLMAFAGEAAYFENRVWWKDTMAVLHRDVTQQVEGILGHTDYAVLVRDAGQGYYLKRDAVDLFGLTDPFIARHSWVHDEGQPPTARLNEQRILDYLFERRKPGIFLLPSWSPSDITSPPGKAMGDARFARDYEYVGFKAGPDRGDDTTRAVYYMLVSVRRDLPDFARISASLRAITQPPPTASGHTNAIATRR